VPLWSDDAVQVFCCITHCTVEFGYLVLVVLIILSVGILMRLTYWEIILLFFFG